MNFPDCSTELKPGEPPGRLWPPAVRPPRGTGEGAGPPGRRGGRSRPFRGRAQQGEGTEDGIGGRGGYPTYLIGTFDFDAQMSGITFWKGDENLRPVYKKSFYEILKIGGNEKQ